ncbi:MAG: hypothetical protein ACRD5B_12330 [Nitrososphaeraceae archaeon]
MGPMQLLSINWIVNSPMGDLEWVMTNTTDGQDVSIDSIVTLPTNSTVIGNAWAQMTLT